jgi:hypothetical protein
MMRRLFVLFFFFFTLVFSLHAQDKVKTVSRPDIPGSFVVDFGFNGTMEGDSLWKHGFFGSRTLNLYYQYPIRFGRSRFSFNPGFGVSLERFKFTNFRALYNPPEGATAEPVERYQLFPTSTLYPTYNMRKIMFINNYLEIPIEFRFDTKPEDIARSFNVALGARAGYLIDSGQKFKYKEDGQTKRLKNKQDYGLTQFRYGLSARIGIGAFNWFGFYNLTPLFQKDKAPGNSENQSTFTAGISINGF